MKKTGKILEGYISNKMSQKDLAGIIDVTPQYINNIINGIKKPSSSFLNKFYKIFDVSKEDIMAIEEYENFRRLPEKVQEELLSLKHRNDKLEKQESSENIEIRVYGTIEKNGIFKKKIAFEKINFFKLQNDSANYFCVFNYCSEYYNNEIQVEDLMIFEEVTYINNVYKIKESYIYFIKLDEEFKIARVEDTVNYLLVRDLNISSKTVVLEKNDRYKLKIIGKLEKNIRSY